MNCPICQAEMIPIHNGNVIGNLPGRPDLSLRTVTGYNCPTQTNLPFGAQTPHYTIRGNNVIVTLFPYRLSMWEMPEAKGGCTLYHYLPNRDDPNQAGRFSEVTRLPLIKLDTAEKLLKKFAIYTIFS